jgi:hypothetical protein
MSYSVSHLLRQTRRSTFNPKVKLGALADLNLSWNALNGRPQPPSSAVVNVNGSDNFSSHALYALSLCSRNLYHISQALLYTHITLSNHGNILRLIRTLLYQPDLAKHVQSLTTDPYPFVPSTVPMEEDLKCQVRKHLNCCQWPEMGDQWFEDFQSDRKEASVAFLLFLLPKLRTLVMCIDGYLRNALLLALDQLSGLDKCRILPFNIFHKIIFKEMASLGLSRKSKQVYLYFG